MVWSAAIEPAILGSRGIGGVALWMYLAIKYTLENKMSTTRLQSMMGMRGKENLTVYMDHHACQVERI